MEKNQYITATEYCHHYGVELSFVSALHQSGLIELVTEAAEPLIPLEQLTRLEKYTRLHYELDINTEGSETITYLLQRIEQLQAELGRLQARLRLYEGEGPAANKVGQNA